MKIFNDLLDKATTTVNATARFTIGLATLSFGIAAVCYGAYITKAVLKSYIGINKKHGDKKIFVFNANLDDDSDKTVDFDSEDK